MQNLDVSTVVFAVVAIFVVFKLRSVLGTRTGAERRPLDPPSPPRARATPTPATGNVIPLGAGARAGGRRRRRRPRRPLERLRRAGLPARGRARRHRRRRTAVYAGRLHRRRARRLRDDRRRLRRGRSDDAAPPAGARCLSRISPARSRRAGRRADDDDDAGLDRRRRNRRGAASSGRRATIAVRFAAKLASATLDSAGAVDRGIGDERRRSPRRLDVHPRRSARAIPTGCWRRPKPFTEAP